MFNTHHFFKFFNTLCCVVLFGSMGAVNAQNVFQNDLWTGANTLSERGASGLEVTDNGNLAIVSQVVVGGVSDILLTPLQANGQIICPDDYYGSSNQQSDLPRYMQKAYDLDALGNLVQNGFIIVGETGSVANKKLLLLRVSATGAILWAGAYGIANNNETGSCVVQAADGGFVAVGQSTNPLTNLTQTFVVRVNSTGGVVWGNLYNFGYANQGFYIDVAPAIMGAPTYIVTGQVQQGNATDLMLMRINNAAGAVIWAKRYYGNNLNTYAEVGKCVKTLADKSGYIVTGTLGNTNNRYNFTLRTQLNGNITWANVYRITNAVNMNTAGVVEIPNNGGFAIAGDALFDNRNLVYLFNITNNGNTINWANTYDYQANAHYASDLRRTSVGAFLITGYLNRTIAGATNADIYAIRTDAVGNTPNTCPKTQRVVTRTAVNKVANLEYSTTSATGSIVEFFRQTPCVNEQWCGIVVADKNETLNNTTDNGVMALQCYPNPSNGTVTVSYPTETPTTVLVYDTAGKLINQTNLFNQSVTLNLSAYQSGLYMVAIVQNGKIVERTKLVLSR